MPTAPRPHRHPDQLRQCDQPCEARRRRPAGRGPGVLMAALASRLQAPLLLIGSTMVAALTVVGAYAVRTTDPEGARAAKRRAAERGDVPGWVLITLMTAGLVTTIWALAGAQLAELFTQAISSVTGPGKR